MPGQITRREVIVDALGKHGRNVILSDDLRNDDLSAACEIVGGSFIQSGDRRFTRKTTCLRLGRWRAASLWITAPLLAAMWVSEAQAAPETRHTQAGGLVIAAHAAAARNAVFGGVAGDPDIGRVQASRFGDGLMRFAQAAIGGTENSPKPPEQQRDQNAADGGVKDDRAARLELDLAAARRAVDTQTALAAKANDEVARLRQEAENGAGELQSFLQREHDRAVRLEQDLADARHGVDTQTALAAKASYEADRFKRALESGAGELRESLKQERDRADRLEQDLAAARRDLETQTALAAKASAEAAQPKQAAASNETDLRKSLQQEHARADQLEQDLAAARRDVETKTALAEKASAEAAQSKQAMANDGSDLQKSLKQERARRPVGAGSCGGAP